MRKSCALFKNEKYDFICVSGEDRESMVDEYVRITEYVAVDFPELDKNTIRVGKIRVLDKAIEEAQEVVYSLIEKKKELLSLTHDEFNSEEPK